MSYSGCPPKVRHENAGPKIAHNNSYANKITQYIVSVSMLNHNILQMFYKLNNNIIVGSSQKGILSPYLLSLSGKSLYQKIIICLPQTLKKHGKPTASKTNICTYVRSEKLHEWNKEKTFKSGSTVIYREKNTFRQNALR